MMSLPSQVRFSAVGSENFLDSQVLNLGFLQYEGYVEIRFLAVANSLFKPQTGVRKRPPATDIPKVVRTVLQDLVSKF